MILCQTYEQLERCIEELEKWSKEYNIEVNKKKSAVMIIRNDRRTPMPIKKEIRGYPIVQHYKYLGVELDDCIRMDIEQAIKK